MRAPLRLRPGSLTLAPELGTFRICLVGQVAIPRDSVTKPNPFGKPGQVLRVRDPLMRAAVRVRITAISLEWLPDALARAGLVLVQTKERCGFVWIATVRRLQAPPRPKAKKRRLAVAV